ncbi:hypothetical protein NSQ82_20315 [Caldifermentibacillus hisashii]|uniref:hypothetical protein n=1 Tax=Caldifermentibacillus hisashii TaxID=996558 RepID=UPI0031B67EDF
MKWQFEISDIPEDANFPVRGLQIMDNGVKRGPFYFRVEDIIQALTKEPDNLHDADGEKAKEESTPVLPVGTVRYSTNKTGSKHRITMVMDKKMWDIRYFDNEYKFYTVGFPRMIVQYLVVPVGSYYRISEMRIYAVLDDRKPISEETPLFVFPYPNVSKGNAIVCWGQNERLEIKNLVELERAFRWFVAAPFNEDHGVRTTFGINRFKTLLDRIKDQPFDDEWLMPMNKTFGQLF